MATWKHYKSLLTKDTFNVFFPSNASKRKDNDTIIIVGRKGSGKTSLLLFLIKLYLRFKPNHHVLIFSQVPENFTQVEGNRVHVFNLNSLVKDADQIGSVIDVFPELSEIENSLVVFDDTENIPDKRINSQMNKFIHLCFQNGRNYGLTVILVLHQMNPGKERTGILKEADSIIMFPGMMDNNLLKTLINHYGFSKQRAFDLFNLPEKFILLRNAEPSYIFGGSSHRLYPATRI